MKTTVNELARSIFNSNNEEILSNKIFNYYKDHLESLRELTEESSWENPDNYDFYLVYYNNRDFWNQMYSKPSTAIGTVGEFYNVNDKYVYKDTTELYESCNDLSDFYNDQDVKRLANTISNQLQQDPINTIINFTPETQEVLLQVLK